jgi:hypothetical protein
LAVELAYAHTTVVGPYFTHHSPTNASSGIVPFYVSAHTPKRDLLVTPLFLTHTNRETRKSEIVSWLYYQSSQGDKMFRTVLPLWFQSRDENTSTAIGFPLLWHFADKSRGQVEDARWAILLGSPWQRTHARPSAPCLVLARRTERIRQQRPHAALLRAPRAAFADLAHAPLRLQAHT